jgi:hypothetical protein
MKGQKDWYNRKVKEAYRLIARHVYGADGEFAYRAFRDLNAIYFGEQLPEPLVLWDLTNWGNCLAWTRSPDEGPPIIKLHPALVHPSKEDGSPWGIPADFIGYPYAFYVLLHECIHVAVNYVLGGYREHPDYKKYWTSHNNPLWISECNRIAGLMGVDVQYTMKTYQRVPTGKLDKKGKPVRKLVYRSDGPDFERFPHCLPGAHEFYRNGQFHFQWPVGPN